MNARVLVVDDDDVLRRALATSLSRAGFQVTTAEDAVPAIELAGGDGFDIVISDFNMQTATGADVVRHYKARFGARVFCVVLSGEDDDETRATCVAAGADAVMQKPTPVGELRRTLAAAVETLRAAA